MIIQRAKENPILKPLSSHAWEGKAVFNGCPAKKDKKIYLVYRALSVSHYHSAARANIETSDIGIAKSSDGIHFQDRKRLIVPEYPWEKFGCEDPRVTKLGKKYYIFYTALSQYPFRAQGIKVALAISRNLERIEEKHLITPFNAKAMTLFPEKIKGKFWAILTVHTDIPPSEICLASFEKEEDLWSERYWQRWYQDFKKHSLPLRKNPQDHLEVGTPPIKTKYGWLLFYSYIRNYFSPQRFFTIEAVLLDLKNPLKIIKRSNFPVLVPEEYYEKIGYVKDIVFPSGALLEKDTLYLYYGAADTVCCLAFLHLPSFLDRFFASERKIKFKRAKENPIILPKKENFWENKATFNPAAIYLQGRVHLLYRAVSQDNVSSFGYASSKDGFYFDERLEEPVYSPREPFEKRKKPDLACGCEDPRLTKIGDKIYMCYTAFDGECPRIAFTWISVKDFLKKNWNWQKPILISPADLNDKDAFIFPEKFRGKYILVHRVGYDIDYSFISGLNFKEETWFEEERWIYRRPGWWDSKKIGAAAPPIKTKDGWILFYHGISDDGVYRVGAVLLDLKNPLKILARLVNPILEPETSYEKEGWVPNVVFPCGAIKIKDKIFLYYGGGDKVCGVATIEVRDLLDLFKKSRYSKN